MARGRTLPPALLLFVLGACNDGRDKWIADLQSNRPEDRATAVAKLAERFNSDDLGLFTQAARDPVPIVRAEAMTALARSQDARVVDLLGEALGDPDELVQEKAARSLAGIRSEKARAYFTLQYARRGRSTRIAIVQAIKGANYPGAMAAVVAAETSSIWERNLKALQEGAVPERVGAAEELGRSGRAEAVNRLVPLLKDSQVVLAAAAARGLGYAQDTRAVPALTALLDESYRDLREAACEALGLLKDSSALPRLVAVVDEHSPISPGAVAAIIALKRSEATDKALCDIVLSGSAEVAAAGREMRRRGGCPTDPIVEKLKASATAPAALGAIVVLGPTIKDVVPKVTPMLGASDSTTRKLAVDALAELADPSSASTVLKAFDAELKALEPLRSDWVPAELPKTYARGFDPDGPVPADDPVAQVKMRTTDLYRRVRQIDEQRARDQGKTLLESPPPRELVDDATEDQVKVLAALVRALGRVRVEGAKEKVLPFTRESSPSLRAAAFVALASLGPDAVSLARPGLLDAERSVQSATALALADSGPTGVAVVADVLMKLPGDRGRLLEALRGHPLPPSVVPALVALVSEGGGEAGTAALLLGDLHAAEAVEPLLKVLDDPTTVARRDVLMALGRLQDTRAAETVARDLYSDSADVRAAAAEALGALGPGTHLEALDALKGDYYLRVREAASFAHTRLSPDGGKR